jgi:hypothetical protein
MPFVALLGLPPAFSALAMARDRAADWLDAGGKKRYNQL